MTVLFAFLAINWGNARMDQILTLEDVIIGARTIAMEGRNQPFGAQKAIAHNLINRAKSPDFPHDSSIAEAALRQWQYSGWNDRDPNREKIRSMSMNDSPIQIAVLALIEAWREPDFTRGSDHYFAISIDPPDWADPSRFVGQWGDHMFYKLRGAAPAHE